ncbi:hypothetical protein, partial [Mesorhizobium sp.]|uniref:hypothetical protein n=1 Tax=Mesorhizobium sp. TaxID=1871066 RepID=UPI0025BFCFB3
MYIKAIHTIQRDPKENPPVIAAGAVANLEGDELDYVLRDDVRAAVKATEEDLVKAGIKQRVDHEAEAAAEAAEKEAAEKAAAEAAEKEA